AEAVVLVACLRTDTPVLVVNGRQPAPMHQALLDEVRRDGYALIVVTSDPPTVLSGAVLPGAVLPGTSSGRPARRPLGPGCLLLASGGTTSRPKLVVDRTIRA